MARKPLFAEIIVLTAGDTPKQLMARGYDPAPMTPEAFHKHLQLEVARRSKAIKQHGIHSTR